MSTISVIDPLTLSKLTMSQNENNQHQHQHQHCSDLYDLEINGKKAPFPSRTELFSNRYFGTKEVGVQTDLTGRLIDDLLERKQESLQQEYAWYQKRQGYDINDQYNNSAFQLKESCYLSTKRRRDLDCAEIETSPQSLQSQKNLIINRLDIIHTMPFIETNASDLSSNAKLEKKDKALIKKNTKISKKKVDAYQLFKNEFIQVHKEIKEDELEKKCKEEWNALDKEVKRFYNMNAELENKALKKMQKKTKADNDNGKDKEVNKKEKENEENEGLINIL